MPIPSHFKDNNQPFYQAQVITKSDTTILDPVPRGIIVSGAGNLAVIFEGDLTLTPITIAVNANIIYPLCVTKVMSTNTTATGIVGLF